MGDQQKTSRFLERFTAFSFDAVSFTVVLVTIFFMLVAFVPTAIVPFLSTKILVLYVGILLSLAFFLGDVLKRGRVSLPVSYIFAPLVAIPVVYIASSLASESPVSGLVGAMLNVQTTVFMLAMVVLVVLTTILFRDKNRIFYSYILFFIAFVVVVLFQIAKLILGGDIISFGVLTTPTSNLVGTWYDFGVLMASVALLSLITLEMLPVGKKFKIVLHGVLGIALAFLVLVDFSLLWILVGFFALFFFVYVYTTNVSRTHISGNTEQVVSNGKSSMYALTLGVLAVSVVIVVSGSAGTYFATIVGTHQQQIFPWSESFVVTKKSVIENPILGVGPNQYDNQWIKYRSENINNSPLWNLEYRSGGGYIPTTLVTTGIVGFVTWVLFLFAYVWLGFRSVFASVASNISRYLIASSFVVSLFLWLVSLFFTPHLTILTLTFFFTGLFFAASAEAGVIKIRTFNLFEVPKVSFVVVMVLVLLLVSTGAFAYFAGRAVIASVHLQNALYTFNTSGSIDDTEKLLIKSLRMRETDETYRVLAELHQIRLNSILQKTEEEITIEEAQRQFQLVLSEAIKVANTAIAYDKSEYRNWITLGQIYHMIVPFGVEGAYEGAIEAYEEAVKRNPTSPALLLLRAQLDRANGNNDGARGFIARALEKKVNYTEARFVLAQMAIEENDVPRAIQALNVATVSDPNNPSLFFQLGVLYYNTKDYVNAEGALERAVALVNDFGNARYFLGLTYAETGKREQAIEQFEVLKKSNPDNKEVQTIFKNLKSGLKPLYGLVEEPIQDRTDLPVDEAGEEETTIINQDQKKDEVNDVPAV